MICFQISIFAKGNTAAEEFFLNLYIVVICFQISIFAKGNTAVMETGITSGQL